MDDLKFCWNLIWIICLSNYRMHSRRTELFIKTEENNMTIKELTETINNYDDIEVYYPLSTGRHYPNYFHTDNCKLVDNYNELSQVGFMS